MKKILLILSILISGVYGVAQEMSPYFKVAEMDGGISAISSQVKDVLAADGFFVIGEYSPANNADLFVLCFTSNQLKDLSTQFKDRGALASVLKVGFVKKEGKVTLSFLNPEYMFLAYWGKQLKGQESRLKDISDKVISAMSSFGKPSPFGGTVDRDDLAGYHYMMMMPYFDDPDELEDFDSFEEGLAVIRKNLEAGKDNTVKVYEQVFEGKEIAVFGVGLADSEEGEAYFLPIIGEDNIANMPYEIILQGKEATALPGKYRLALFWPSLTMSQFMKISSTPGDIKDVMEELTDD
jgi:hypothetical protein